ncbi:MAG: SDR family NAD(P)-dependent oxidoreductase [Lachnospiraceae bacterium]|nr:SDR family NAD(P)-dependent oxidoreductase [Lachnospiraceae bacterium]
MKKKIAIITGASSGLGREFARGLDEKEKLDEIWAIARREELLDELCSQVSTSLRPIPLDLTQKESFEVLHSLLQEEEPDVRYLINAAGFGKIGSWKDISLQDCDDMIDLNCRAAVDLTQLALPYMSKGTRILEICSTAAFQPFPYLNVYSASKAFLYRYSRALRIELFGEGIHVTAVCPYWIKDTEFIDTAKKTADSSYIRHFPLASREKTVVRHALIDAGLGVPVSTPGIVCTLHRIAAKFIPGEIMMGIWALLRRI